MCGIVGGLGLTVGDVERAMRAVAHRGPDARGVEAVGDAVLGHVRLSILDTSSASDQPMRRGRTILAYNGEVWNYRELRSELEEAGKKFTTTGDAEVLATALDQWGADAVPRLQGMFAAAWVTDDRPDRVMLARDRFGEVPLHVAAHSGKVAFCSEVKGLAAAGLDQRAAAWVPPSCVVELTRGGISAQRYYSLSESKVDNADWPAAVRDGLAEGVRERAMSDVPVCSLLSGGVDSSAVAVLAKAEMGRLTCYTAVMDKRSADLRRARELADVAGLKLVEVEVEAPSADDLARVIGVIEMPHKAQVEIGWACLKLAERMSGDGFKVVFSGEGSDELWGSYGFAYHGIRQSGWRPYREELFCGQHRKNFARCNKVFMAHGVECRLPFLNTGLVETAMSCPESAVRRRGTDKAVLQDAMRDALPAAICDRAKVAFQDGMGLKRAIEGSIGSPRRFYGNEFKRQYGFRA